MQRIIKSTTLIALTLCLLSTHTIFAGTPFPTAGTVTEIDAEIHTNISIPTLEAEFGINTIQKAHAKCQAVGPFIGSSSLWEFDSTFSSLHATFEDTPLGQIVISKNDAFPAAAHHVSLSTTEATFPATGTVSLFLRVEVAGLTLVNQTAIIIEGTVNGWPQEGDTYTAVTGPVDFFHDDGTGHPTGPAVAQLSGTIVTVLDDTTESGR